jgi:hypothetical protein
VKTTKNKIYILVIVIVLVVSLTAGLAYFLYSKNQDRGGLYAVVTVDGEEYERIDLSRVGEPYDRTIETEWGYNILHVENGSISVTDADCTGHDCVEMGTLTSPGYLIVCLPHRMVITIESEGEE